MNKYRIAMGLAVSVSSVAMAVSNPALAQDAGDGQATSVTTNVPTDEDEAATIATTDAEGDPNQGQILVTGSRIKQPSTYTSISPIQVITGQSSRDVGEFDPAQVLQRSESAAGQQIDASFSGYVLPNGPGSQTLDLRGLGADRTLLLLNGRRLAPSGVEGSPSNPSINMLPGSLIARYDLLLDGASSVYGSDAVAGVGNIILRKDFTGLELYAEGNLNPHGGGDDYTVSAAWGKTFDRGFFGFGAEYAYRDAVRFGDRPFLSNCDQNYEVDQNGNVRTIDLRTNALVRQVNPNISTSEGACKLTNLTGRIFVEQTNYGSIYYTGGAGNTFIPGFSDSALLGRNIDANGDGIRDVDFQKQNAEFDPSQVLINQQKVYNVMAYGEYSLGGAANITPFFEANFSRVEVFNENNGAAQLFPEVPAENAFNPCNFLTNPSGVDCRAAENKRRAALGLPGGLSTGFILPVAPIVAVVGDRNNTDVVQDQYRGVLGVKGDLPFIAPSWSFEVAGVYSHSKGVSVRRGIREDKLALSLGVDPTADFNDDGIADNDGDGIADDYDSSLPIGGVFGGPVITPCTGTLANPNLAAPDLLKGCVPVNLFTPELLGKPIGNLTEAERAYLFSERRFDTTYDQFLINAYATGNLFHIAPGGDVALVIGGEYREDKVDSRPDFVASNGLQFAFSQDRGASGKKHVKEAFAELDIPLLLNQRAAQELRVNLSGRLTDDQYYGTAETYSMKLGWRPIEQLLFKMSYGTSFRAPNLRENFLAGQSGFPTITDPCAVPTDAFKPLPGSTDNIYQPGLDTRDPAIISNCIREGRDPTKVGIDAQKLNTLQVFGIESTTGGSLDLDPETSTSFTTGVAFGDRWGPLSLNLNVNYYNIQVTDSIIEPSEQFIINDCFARVDGIRSQFCDRITSSTSINDRFLISDVEAGFINLNKDKVRGLDFNASAGYDLQLGDRSLVLGLNVRANRLLERSTVFIDDDGVQSLDEDKGQFGFPKWTGRATFTAAMDNLTFTWQTRYIGPVEEEDADIEPLSDAFGYGPDGQKTPGFAGDTCLGGGSRNAAGVPDGIVPGDGIYCRDIGYAGKYFTHTASIRYTTDRWEARIGVSNIFDRAPPKVDGSEVFARNNNPIGNGYDFDGREFFASARIKF